MHPDVNIGILDISSDRSKLSFSGNAAVVAALLLAVLCKYTAQLRGRGRGRDIVFSYLMYLSFLSKNGDCRHLMQLCVIFGFRLQKLTQPAVFY